MTSKKFVTDVMARYPYIGVMKDWEKAALKEDLEDFSKNRDEKVLKDLFEKFKITDFKKSKPKLWWFLNNKTDKEEKGHWWWKCIDCEKQFTNEGSSCPECGSFFAEVMRGRVGSTLPGVVLQVREDCSICHVFKDNRGDPSVHGGKCEFFGKGIPQGYCDKCLCKRCCEYADVHRNHPRKYKNLSDEDKRMPWIEESGALNFSKILKGTKEI